MTQVFADTSFFVAFLNARDEHHSAAGDYMANFAGRIFTSVWVLVELGNFLSAGPDRRRFAPFIKDLRTDQRFVIVPAAAVDFDRAVQLYARRADKQWSLTDMASFMLMKAEGLSEALTADHHFEQAGFTILLK